MNFLKFVYLLICGDFVKTGYLFGSSGEGLSTGHHSGNRLQG